MKEKCKAYVELMKAVSFLASDFDDGPFAIPVQYFAESIGHDMMRQGMSADQATNRLALAMNIMETDKIVSLMLEGLGGIE